MAFMDIPKAAKILNLTEDQLSRDLRTGKLAGRKLGTHWYPDGPAVYERYRRQGGPMPIPGDLVEVSIPGVHREYILSRHPHLRAVADWSGLLTEVEDWFTIHSPIDIVMNVVVANTATGSQNEGGISFEARLVLHESGELRQAEDSYNPTSHKIERLVWSDKVDHFRRMPGGGDRRQ